MIRVTKDILDPSCIWDGPNKEYRYVLRRVWDYSKPKIAFICLNPSTASEEIDDNTVRKCINIARRDGYGSLSMLNAYAYRSTDPKALTTQPNAVGPHNDYHIAKECRTAEKTVVAWGNHATDERHTALLRMLENQPMVFC